MSLTQLSILGSLIYLAGVVDSLAGGGGLITLPAYLAVGLPPQFVLGTNKLSSSIGTVASSVNYQRKSRIHLKKFAWAILFSLLGSALGARMATFINAQWIRYLLIGIMPPMVYFLHFHRDYGREDHSAHLKASVLFWRQNFVASSLGIYDGIFGPGTGTFLALGLTRFCHYDWLSATARAKWLNLASNVSALTVFLAAGRVQIELGAIMGVLSIAGHWTGSHMGIKWGARIIRPVIMLVCAGLFLKLLRG